MAQSSQTLLLSQHSLQKQSQLLGSISMICSTVFALKRHPWQICIVLASDLNFRVIYSPVLPAFDMCFTEQGMAISLSNVVKNNTLASVTTACFKNSVLGLGFSKMKARSISTFSPTTLLTRSSNLSPALKQYRHWLLLLETLWLWDFAPEVSRWWICRHIVVTRSWTSPLFTV